MEKSLKIRQIWNRSSKQRSVINRTDTSPVQPSLRRVLAPFLMFIFSVALVFGAPQGIMDRLFMATAPLTETGKTQAALLESDGAMGSIYLQTMDTASYNVETIQDVQTATGPLDTSLAIHLFLKETTAVLGALGIVISSILSIISLIKKGPSPGGSRPPGSRL